MKNDKKYVEASREFIKQLQANKNTEKEKFLSVFCIKILREIGGPHE